MTRHFRDVPAQNAVTSRKPWFLPALAAVLVIGGLLFYAVRHAGGPSRPLVDPAAAERDKASYERAMALLERGRPYLESGNYSQAMSLAEEALSLRGDLAITHMAVAQVALQMHDYDRAEQEFRAVLERHPDAGGQQEALLSLAVVAAARKQYDSARRQVEAVLSKADRQQAARAVPVLVLQAAANLDRPEVAARYMGDALDQEKNRGQVLLETAVYGPDVTALLAEHLDRRNKPEEAARAFALAAGGTSGNVLKAQRAGRAAELFLAAGKPEAAGDLVKGALEADPSNPQWVLLADRVRAASSAPAASQPAIHVPGISLPVN